MKKHKKLKIALILLLVTILVLAGYFIGNGISMYNMYSKITQMDYNEMINYTLENQPEGVITVGIIQNGEASYQVFGEDGALLDLEDHDYEVGSITKTFTSSLISKAVEEGKLNLLDTIDLHLDLPEGNSYPTIAELLTHTAGYDGYYFESEMIGNFLSGKNDFNGISKEKILNKVKSISVDKEEYSYNYSNFGFATLGLVLEEIYEDDYTSLVNSFAQEELGLENTEISKKAGDLANYWDWNAQDGYLPAGGIVSTISDMLKYAQIQLNEEESFIQATHSSLKTVNATTSQYEIFDIRLDSIGMAWVLDDENGLIWHNGATGHYNSYLGIDKENQTAVVVLSNLSASHRANATFIGINLILSLKA